MVVAMDYPRPIYGRIEKNSNSEILIRYRVARLKKIQPLAHGKAMDFDFKFLTVWKGK